jgi:protein-S-isoprenylcysteine O-methyltransferase Ste14
MIKLDKFGYRYIVFVLVTQLILTVLLIISVGNFNIVRVWIFLIVIWIYQLFDLVILYLKSPELLNQRGKRKKTERFDRIVLPLYFLIGVYITIIIAGLDIGRYYWSFIPDFFIFVGVMLLIIADSIALSAMLKNIFFESTVRIQSDRNQTVVKTGPYKFVRHPGYLGAIIWQIATPLVLGSIVAFLPSIVGIALKVLRTYLEDRTLTQRLPGYAEYTKQTKYRLIPWIW